MDSDGVSIVIYCHNRLLSEGLACILASERAFHIRGAFDADTAPEEIARIGADVIITDLDNFRLISGFFPGGEKKILLVCNTAINGPARIARPDLIAGDISGILPYGTDPKLLIKSVKAVCSGELWIDHKTLRMVLSGEQRNGECLTKQEMNIGSYICKGLRNKEIARELNISEQTVKSHCNRIYKKLGVSDRLQLALLFMKEGISPAQTA